MARFTLGGAATPSTTAKFSTGINSFGVKRIQLDTVPVDIDETSGLAVYTVEGNSGDACKIKSYPLDYACIKGYGLMNWN